MGHPHRKSTRRHPIAVKSNALPADVAATSKPNPNTNRNSQLLSMGRQRCASRTKRRCMNISHEKINTYERLTKFNIHSHSLTHPLTHSLMTHSLTHNDWLTQSRFVVRQQEKSLDNFGYGYWETRPYFGYGWLTLTHTPPVRSVIVQKKITPTLTVVKIPKRWQHFSPVLRMGRTHNIHHQHVLSW